MREKYYYVYIITNKINGTLYIGITSNLAKRIWQHKQKFVKGFSNEHNLSRLIYFEVHRDVLSAITREKQIKAWKRNWKLRLIEDNNPNWDDLYSYISQ